MKKNPIEKLDRPLKILPTIRVQKISVRLFRIAKLSQVNQNLAKVRTQLNSLSALSELLRLKRTKVVLHTVPASLKRQNIPLETIIQLNQET